MTNFRILPGGCPANKTIAPYLYVLAKTANGHYNSVYRGSDAAPILHRYGLRTQAEIHRDLPLISNPEGQSTHDGHLGGAYPGPKTAKADWWQQGFDVNDDMVEKFEAAARKYGWELFRPYPRGAEYHHLCFKHKPRPHSAHMRAKLTYYRAKLPKA